MYGGEYVGGGNMEYSRMIRVYVYNSIKKNLVFTVY